MLINFISVVGVLASLYYSEVEELPPCTLCWYARILFYPVVIISTIALISKDQKVAKYIFALSTPGVFLTGYHYLLQKTDFIKSVANTCGVGEGSCSTIDVEYFGFITIPLMAFVGFLMLSVLSFIKLKAKEVVPNTNDIKL